MSHLPYVLQARLGWGPEAHGGSGPRSPRNENPTSATPTSFRLNWDHCENGSAHPVACAGVTTWMGPPISKRAGMGADCLEASGATLVFAAERLRGAGWSVAIVPEGWRVDRKDNGDGDEEDKGGSRKRQKTEGGGTEKSLRERELAYIRSSDYNFEEFKVYDTDKKEHIASFEAMSLKSPWLCLSCLKGEVSGRISELLREDYDLAEFPHVKEDLSISRQLIDAPGKFRLETVTGSKSTDASKSSVTTLFSIYFRDESSEGDGSANEKVVAKVLCSYHNSEMDSVGPTLELMETAKEWRQHGLGDALMRSIHSFYCAKFGEFGGRVLFSVCHVTNFYAGKWFMRRHHFRDLDGMGEELGKYLCADEYDGDEEDGDGDEDEDYRVND